MRLDSSNLLRPCARRVGITNINYRSTHVPQVKYWSPSARINPNVALAEFPRDRVTDAAARTRHDSNERFVWIIVSYPNRYQVRSAYIPLLG